MSTQDFLFEIRTEEIPAAALLPARLELARGTARVSGRKGLAPATVESYATPRRLVLVLRGLPERQGTASRRCVGPPAANAFAADG